jgi:hypothetical protein
MIDSTNFFVLEDFESHINKTYTYNFPIEEVFKAFTDRELLLKLYPYQISLYSLLGETFIEDEGNEISLMINGKEHIILKIIKVTKSPYYYQIKAKTIQHPLEYVPFTVHIEFFWDSIKEATIFNGQINIAKTTSQLKFISDFKKMTIFPTEAIDEYLKNNVKNLEQNESILVNVSIDKLWNFCKQIQNIHLFVSMPNTEIINEGNNILKLVDKNNNNFVRLIEREKKLEDSNYILYLESFDSLISMPLQSMQIQLIKVNENKTLIIYKHIMLDYIPYNALKSNSGNKQKILKKIKKLLENKEKGKE